MERGAGGARRGTGREVRGLGAARARGVRGLGAGWGGSGGRARGGAGAHTSPRAEARADSGESLLVRACGAIRALRGRPG